MSLSRLQLAAALLEYDNDAENPTRPPVSHRQSALFKPFQPGPLCPPYSPSRSSERYNDGRIGLVGLSGDYEQGGDLSQRQDDNQATSSRSRPLQNRRESSYSSQWDRGEAGHGEFGQRDKEGDHQREAQEVDVSRWGIPDHLLSPTSTSFPPGEGDTLLRHAPSNNTTPHEPNHRSVPPLRMSTGGIQPQTIPSPMQGRNSVHLDVMDGLEADNSTDSQRAATGGDGRDEFEHANEVLAQSARLREMAMGSYVTGPSRVRQSSNPIMVPLPPSPATTLNHFARPGSSMSGTGRPASILSMERDGRGDRHGGMTSPGVENRGVRSQQSRYEEDAELLDEEDHSPNPFAIPPPPVQIGSRFDPKILDAQRRSLDGGGRPGSSMSMNMRPMSRATLSGSRRSMDGLESATALSFPESRDYLPTPRRNSMAHHLEDAAGEQDRQRSNRLMRPSKVYDEVPTAEEYGKPLRPQKYGPAKPVDRRSLLRPQSLVMPSLLSAIPPSEPPRKKVPEGYTLGEKPLPPGSRSSILTLNNGRPGLPLSLSQKTFRSSLLVDGKRDDEEYWIGGAEEEGQVGVRAVEGDEQGAADRRPGRLYGRSLMDQLESRKAEMKGKQRVFTGDNRPSMMARSSTYGRIDAAQPDSPGDPPMTIIDYTGGPRPQSMINTAQQGPLLSVEANGEVVANQRDTIRKDRITKSKSVFGVDQIWEKEMAKLKLIQEQEDKEKEAARAKAEAEEVGGKKGKGIFKKDKGKGKAKDPISDTGIPTLAPPISSESVNPGYDHGEREDGDGGVSPVKPISTLPPKLSFSPEKRMSTMMPIDPNAPRRRAEGRGDLAGWSDSDDDEANERRRRAKAKAKAKARVKPDRLESDSDSEEDVPLSRLAKRSPQVNTMAIPEIPHSVTEESDEDEDIPLSKLKSPAAQITITSPVLQLGTDAALGSGSLGLEIPTSDLDPKAPSDDAPTAPIANTPIASMDDDDDLPLYLKKAAAIPPAGTGDDDVPLAFKLAGGRQSQFQAPQYPQMQEWSGMYPTMGYAPPASWYGGMPMPSMAPQYPAYNPYQGYQPTGMMPMGVQPPMFPPMPTMPQFPSMGSMDIAAMVRPPDPSKNIDSWRQQVAIQPTPTGATGASVPVSARSST